MGYISQDKKSKCIDSMKVKVDLSEVRLKELTAELLKKNDESLQLKVMEAIT